MALYRGQTTTMQKIQAVSSLQITTTEEAVAFLRAISNINMQIASILQRNNLTMASLRSAVNKQEEKTDKPVETVDTSVAVEEVKEEKISFDDTEQHSESEKEARVAKLRKATKK